MIILNVRFGRELRIITASISTTAFGERMRQQSTPCRHIIQISEWQISHGTRTVDTSEPTDTTD